MSGLTVRSLRRAALRGLAASALIAAVAITLMPTSNAEEPSVVGWWYRDVPLSGDDAQAQSTGAPVIANLVTGTARSSQVPPAPGLPPTPLPTTPPDVTVPDPTPGTPTPSQAPEGGLLVAADVTGIRAMSALRFVVSDAGSAILTLTIATGSTPSPGVRACPALSDWLPGPDQPWSARPAHDCERLAVSSSPSPDGTQMSWTLPDTFVRPGSVVYDVLLVPISGDGTPFQIAFEKPDSSSFEVTSPAPEETPPVTYELPDDIPPPIEYFSPDGFDFSYGGGGPIPDFSEGTAQLQPAGDRGSSNPIARAARALENPTTRRIATGLLILLGGAAYWQARQTVQRAPRLLGALGGSDAVDSVVSPSLARPRGIGRFARVRANPPPRL